VSAVREEQIAALRGVARAPLATMVAAWGPVALWVAVIFALSSEQFSDVNTAAWISNMPFAPALGLSPAVIEVGNLIVRKCAHFVEYAVLSMLAFRALRATRPQLAVRRLLVAVLALAAVCASADELHQHLGTLTRSGTATDVVLDAIGACAGAGAGVAFLYRRTRRAAA
jgi:VanZ family protein